MSVRACLVNCCLFALLSGCGDSTESGGGGSSKLEDLAEIHFLELYRLQGLAEDIPCTAEEFQPLAAAAARRNQLRNRGQSAFLVAIGDTIMPSFPDVSDWTQSHAMRTRGHVVLEAMQHARVDMYIPGESDLGEEAEAILDRCTELGIKVLMTNVTVPGRDDILPYVIVEDGGLRVACLGITRVSAGGRGPAQAITASIAVKNVSQQLVENGEADFVLVFCNVWQRAALDICKLPYVNAVIGSIGGTNATSTIMNRDGAAYMLVKDQGLEVGHTTLRVVDGNLDELVDVSPLHSLPRRIAEDEAELDAIERRFGTKDPSALARLAMPGLEDYFLRKVGLIEENRATVAALREVTGSTIDHGPAETPTVSDEHVVVSSLSAINKRIRTSFERFDQQGLSPPRYEPDPRGYIPHSDTCMECHQDQYDFWLSTAHSRSFETLQELDSTLDVECLGCHTSGYNKPGGYYDPRIPAPIGPVGCYECHYTTSRHIAGDEHVVDPFEYSSLADNIACQDCHNETRFPDFNRYEAMKQVRCPPMIQNEPPLLQARQAALTILETRERFDESLEGDAYLKARALLGLGRISEGTEAMLAIAGENTRNVRLAIEIARTLDESKQSEAALRSLKDFLLHQMGEPNANREYVRLLLEPSDPEARDPEEALRHLAFLVPPEEESEKAMVEFRVLEVDALFMSGREEDGRRLLNKLLSTETENQDVLTRAERWFGEVRLPSKSFLEPR